MNSKLWLIQLIVLFFALPATAANIPDLANCSVKIFTEISKTGIWSGAAPAECPPQVQVEKRRDKLFVTTWVVEQGKSGWLRTAFTCAMSKAELKSEVKSKRSVAKAGTDINARAKRLGQCLDLNKKSNDAIKCLNYESEAYLGGKHGGTEHKLMIWLDDKAHLTKAEIAYGDTSYTPTPPTDLFNGEIIPPGARIDWKRAVIKPSGNK